ncbi:hypothetical protein ACP70R_007395 [Stipagrostis hirtigluma subsp. patula]
MDQLGVSITGSTASAEEPAVAAPPVPLGDALDGGVLEPPGDDDVAAEVLEFLGRPTPFAAAHCTAGFMRLAAEEAEPGQDGGDGGGGEIFVHYRYTQFSWSGALVVDWNNSKLMIHEPAFRFLVPFPAGGADMASSLLLAGAALWKIAYPIGYHLQLQALWSSLVAVADPVRVPPQTARLMVTVDVGILRREDRTPERMTCMPVFLQALAHRADELPPAFCFDMELPAPVRWDDDGDDEGEEDEGKQPAKKHGGFATGEECAICCDALDGDLAAWPRCSHVFHGKCLEQLLIKVMKVPDQCPLCRSELDIRYCERITMEDYINLVGVVYRDDPATKEQFLSALSGSP